MTQEFVYSIFQCMQPEDSLKIDFYFEVFKQLKDHVLSYLTGAT